MCGNIVDIQSPTAEIRRGKKKEEEEEETTGWKYIWPALLHTATIKKEKVNFTLLNTKYLATYQRYPIVFLRWNYSISNNWLEHWKPYKRIREVLLCGHDLLSFVRNFCFFSVRGVWKILQNIPDNLLRYLVGLSEYILLISCRHQARLFTY